MEVSTSGLNRILPRFVVTDYGVDNDQSLAHTRHQDNEFEYAFGNQALIKVAITGLWRVATKVAMYRPQR